MTGHKLENSTWFTYGSPEPSSTKPENSPQFQGFQMQNINLHKALQIYRRLYYLDEKHSIFVSEAFTLFGRTNKPCWTNTQPWWFFPSSNKPVLEFTHGLVLYVSVTWRLVTVLLGIDWWSTGRPGEETSSFGQLYRYENGQLHLPECHLCQKFIKSTGKHLICRHSILSTKRMNYEQ